MALQVRPTAVHGVLLIEPDVYGDARGMFFELWRRDRYAEVGLPEGFVQDNVSRSSRGVLRGLHVQEPFAQAKLVQVLEGEVFDVALDVRVGSPTYGLWAGERLSSENHRQMYLPAGIAHGFCVMSETALLTYKCTELYHPEAEMSIAWNDPAVGVEWPVRNPVLSPKDARAPNLSELPADRLPRWNP